MYKSRHVAVAASSAAVALAAASMAPVSVPGVVPVAWAAATGATPASGGVLHVAMPWASVPDDFNPLSPGGTTTTAGGTGSAIYEPLIYVNPYTGLLTDMLGTAFTWSDSNRQLSITTRQGVTWDDGQPFSAADVAFTFNLLKKYPALDVNGLFRSGHLSSVTAGGPDQVVFTFSSPDTAAFDQIVGQSIVPEHIWSKVANPVTFTNAKNPVGTGPFELGSYTAHQVTYKKNPNYWVPGLPYISGITMTAARTAAGAELAMLQGQAAETYAAFVAPQRTFVAVHPAWDSYWWPVTNLNLLYLNDEEGPFSAVNLRRAVAEAINTTVVADRAYFGAIPAANEASLTGGTAGQWLPASVKSLEWAQNPAKALSLLSAHGYKVVDGHLRTPTGSTLPTFRILIGAGWADYLSIAETISQQLQAIGISAVIDQEPLGTYQSHLRSGDFTMALSWTTEGGGTPYYLYDQLLGQLPSAGTDPATNNTPGGTSTSADWERYSSPSVAAALLQFDSKTGAQAQQAAIATIERDLLREVPVVPLTGRPNFLDYSTHYFTGWPSALHPYDAAEPPDAFGGGAEQVFLHVHSS